MDIEPFTLTQSGCGTSFVTIVWPPVGDVGGDVASATASSEELRWVTWPLA